MTTKIYFCPQCAIMLSLKAEPDEGDTCANCNCDLFSEDPIVGEFADDDAKHLQSMEEIL